jgi:hypothetical protein
MLHYLLEKNNINLIEKCGLTELDCLFIDEIISGTKEEDRKGRDSSKFYLYDVVNNSRSGLDVDKLDYFQRDMFMTLNAGNLSLSILFSICNIIIINYIYIYILIFIFLFMYFFSIISL